jgi:galactonate dehydratase
MMKITALETMNTDVPWRLQVTNEWVRMRHGEMLIPTAPGLGLDLNLEAIARHSCERRNLRPYNGELTAIRPSDAASWFTCEENDDAVR